MDLALPSSVGMSVGAGGFQGVKTPRPLVIMQKGAQQMEKH